MPYPGLFEGGFSDSFFEQIVATIVSEYSVVLDTGIFKPGTRRPVASACLVS